MSNLHEPDAEEKDFELESETEWERRRDAMTEPTVSPRDRDAAIKFLDDSKWDERVWGERVEMLSGLLAAHCAEAEERSWFAECRVFAERVAEIIRKEPDRELAARAVLYMAHNEEPLKALLARRDAEILRADFKRQRSRRIWRVLEPWLVGALLGAAVGLMFCLAYVRSL